jgi:hypothetical protein
MGIFDFWKNKPSDTDEGFQKAIQDMSDSIGADKFNELAKKAYADMKDGKIINLSEELSKNVEKQRLSQVGSDFQELQELVKNRFGGGTINDNISHGFGRFGLDSTNPIPVNGIGGGYEYLSELKDRKGNSVTYKRLGAISVDNISGLVDQYEIFDSDGSLICQIHLSPYNSKNSKDRPQGLY